MHDYTMPGEETGNSPGQSEAQPEATSLTGDGKQTIMLSADMLGEMQPKNGQKLTFCCTADPDSEGNVSGYFEPTNEGASDAGESGEPWENEFERTMSPREGEK